TVQAVMVAVAGYVNFTNTDTPETVMNYEEYTYEENINDMADITVIADDYDMEFAEGTGISDPLTAEVFGEEDDTGAAVLVSADVSDDDGTYFVEAKLDREQSRAKQKDILTEMINNSKLDSTQKDEAAKSLMKIQERIEKESASEDMIKAKGFSQVYVRIDDDTVDVVVNADNLTEKQLAQIQDIVTRKTGYGANKIRISPLKQK
ncbi:MAG: SpoIIIAH-like family protein, partial [Firmicutes bacterium]|nr:SpoIIIAH-like family protein [Bacillota bacterium]